MKCLRKKALKFMVEVIREEEKKLRSCRRTSGLLIVDKPAGWTSHDIVAKLRKHLGVRKIGHAGTLDPDATGLLPLCVGQAARITEYLMDIPKAYRVRLKFGEETDTDDASGRVIRKTEISGITEEQVRSALNLFSGEIQQVPPLFSAVRKHGRRLYEYARKGEDVCREPRAVTIYEIREGECRLPEISFWVRCSRGTYMRSLCRDIGRVMGMSAHMSRLRRTESASFTEKDAHPLSEITAMNPDDVTALLVPMDVPLSHFIPVVVRSDRIQKIRYGQPLDQEDLAGMPDSWQTGRLCRLYGEDGDFLSIGRLDRSPSGVPNVHPKKVFCQDEKIALLDSSDMLKSNRQKE